VGDLHPRLRHQARAVDPPALFFKRNTIDLLAIMPAGFFRALRVLRLARLLRVVRAATVVGRVLREVRGVAYTNGLNWILVVSTCTITAGALVVWIVEPTIDSLPDAAWWSVVTATTVGYGDLSPENPLARVVAVVLMLVGIGTIGVLTGSIATYFIGDRAEDADPDIAHIRGRLGDWENPTPQERPRLASMIEAVASAPLDRRHAWVRVTGPPHAASMELGDAEVDARTGICVRNADGEPTTVVVLRSGHTLRAGRSAEVLVADDAGPKWEHIEALRVGDHVAVRYGGHTWPTEQPSFGAFDPPAAHGSQKALRTPTHLTDDLAMLLGMYVAEGSSVASNWTVSITNADRGVLELAAQLISEHFAVEPYIQTGFDRCGSARLASKRFIEWLDFIGAGRTAYVKRIPPAVLDAPRDAAIAFLRGLALDGYTTLSGGSPRWALCVASGLLLDDLQVLLTRLGIVHSRIEKWNAEYGRSYGEVYASGRHAQRLIGLAPFLERDKARRAAPLLKIDVRGGSWDAVPGLDPRALYDAIPRGRSGRNGYGYRSAFGHLRDRRTRHVSRRTLQRLAEVPGAQMPPWAQLVLCSNLHLTPVAAIGPADVNPPSSSNAP
jgi:hypothetical protein